jgi:hypothetical protein
MNYFLKLLLISVIFQTTIFAGEWNCIIKCHTSDGVTVIDRNEYNRTIYQLVIRDQNTINSFLKNEAIFEEQINDKNEFITTLYSGIRDNFHYTTDVNGIKRKYQATYFNGALLIEVFAIAEDGRTILYKISEQSFHYCN